MGQPEIFLEHSRGDKRNKMLRVKPERSLFVIGSSKEADLRIHGEGVVGCHAALRYRAPHWYICNLSGTELLKVNDQVVNEAIVDSSAKVEIAGHRLQLFTKERETELFAKDETRNGVAVHQVVVRSKSGRVIETHILGPNEDYSFLSGEEKMTMRAPTSSRWVKTQIGARMIQQRLVEAQELVLADRLTVDREIRRAMAMALVFFVMIFSSIWILSPSASEKKPEVALDKKSMDIIYSAKTVQKKKLESKKVEKAAKARAGGNNEMAANRPTPQAMPEESQAPKVSDKPTAALTSLRQSGLSNLVGKIAKRANKQGVMVAAVGVSPDTVGAGRAFYSTGTSTTGGGGSAAKEGTFRLGGVATKGKAGGVGNFKDGTALAGGSIGTGNLVAMVDEETVIEGGLDRDAIAEVIRRNLGQIRYCYERQLSSNPDLYGKVLVKWSIGAGGEVSAQRVDTSTLKSDMVEGCILRRMASWTFPLPKGGTQVNVSYPFLFKAN